METFIVCLRNFLMWPMFFHVAMSIVIGDTNMWRQEGESIGDV